jgi:hypothetical protein
VPAVAFLRPHGGGALVGVDLATRHPAPSSENSLRRVKGFGPLATVQAIEDGRCGISLVANGTNERHARVAGVTSPVGARDFWWAIQDLNL